MAIPSTGIGAAEQRPGLAQGFTVIIAGFLPILAIVSMFPAIPAIIGHFAPTDPLDYPQLVQIRRIKLELPFLFY